jgi:hypothetical protein
MATMVKTGFRSLFEAVSPVFCRFCGGKTKKQNSRRGGDRRLLDPPLYKTSMFFLKYIKKQIAQS